MEENTIGLIVCLAPVVFGAIFFVGMNVYVCAKVKRRVQELERIAAIVSPVGFDRQAWEEEMAECREWLHHGWPEPGCIYQGPVIGRYGFPYVRRKRRAVDDSRFLVPAKDRQPPSNFDLWIT